MLDEQRHNQADYSSDPHHHTAQASNTSSASKAAAPSRGSSPSSMTSVRTSLAMPSPRSSPALRPTSPLSPRFEASRFDNNFLQPPSPRSHQSRSNKSGGRRTGNTSLRLPSLPRFHPANFPSAHSSYQTTPDDATSAHGPLSPRSHQRMYSDAQKQLLMYHRENIAAARATSPMREKPNSPRLAPLGSPGPVTPLELEGEEEYLVAGVKNGSKSTASAKELVDRLIREEARRTNRTSQSHTAQRSPGQS